MTAIDYALCGWIAGTSFMTLAIVLIDWRYRR